MYYCIKIRANICSNTASIIYSGLFLLLLTFVNQAGANNENLRTSVWDFALPSLDLSNVEINAVSLQDAWEQISSNFLLRSVLVVSDNTLTDAPFTFKARRCSGAELLDALAASYRDFMWTQDRNTGVIWFHPIDFPLAKILPSKIQIDNEQLGVPMQTGILEAIEDIPNGIRVKQWGTGFTNTFNYPVDLHAGEYSVREILNACCVSNPNKTFYIQLYTKREPQFTVISAVNLLPLSALTAPRPGVLLFWKLTIGNLTAPAPTNEQIAAELSNSDSKIRWAACKYTEAMLLSHWDFPYEEWMNKSQSPEQALWICLSAINVFVHSEKATYIDGIKKMQSVNKDFFEKGDPNLAVLVALELAQLANDANALNIVSQRKFTPCALKQIKSEINYNARISSKVRNALRATGTNWLSASDSSFKDIDKIPLKASFIKNN
ncbi:MAG: hypothetical protein ABSB91_02780 [Sedimentisphaerales bacterium]